MPAPSSYTFFGVVEDGYVNDAISVVPEAFGYAVGQRLTGTLTLKDSVLASWTMSPADARLLGMTTELARSEVDFFFPQSGAVFGNWSEADFSSGLSLGSYDDRRPLMDLRAVLFHSSEPDGPTLRLDQMEIGGALLTNDDGLAALVSGAWVPSTVSPNLVYGTAEEDHLRARGDLSLVWGGAGEDRIEVRSGAAFVWGGEGDDVITGGRDRDFIWGGIGDDRIIGQAGDDFIHGGFGDDVLEGGSGNDRVWGGAGFDTVRGGAGHDVLDGGGGLDHVYGGAGDDFIVSGTGHRDESFELERSVSDGGSGNDIILATTDAILTGGSGADIFQLGIFERREAGLGGITITDFRAGIDRIAIVAGEAGQFDSFEKIMAHAEQVGSDVVFEFFGSEVTDLPSLVLDDVKLDRLSPGDFLFGDI